MSNANWVSAAGHSQYSTRILFKAGNWQLKEYPYKDNWNSLILHVCPQNRSKDRELIPMWRLPTGIIRGFTDCPRCSEKVPDSVLTLWKLHNMEQIQRYHTEFGGELEKDKQ